uniref:Phosphatidylinositol-3 4 5-trisphosphate 3-phosphatase and dual-specificity protein phosphatase PTEN n=1 Tax=Rhizophora mucronata TaxID=61149 RepID=A0A2P2L9P2_RHIMU
MMSLKEGNHFFHVIPIEALKEPKKPRANITSRKPHGNDILSDISHIQVKSSLLISTLVLGNDMPCLDLHSLDSTFRRIN